MKKLLVCDLDGTLLDAHNQIDDASLAQLKGYVQAGNEFVVCTGRLDEDIKYVERQIGVAGAYRISQNGAVVRDQAGDLVSQATIPHALVPMINGIVFDQGLRVEVSDINHRYFPSPRDPSQVAEFVDTSIVKNDLVGFIEQPSFQPVIYLIFGDTATFQPLIKALKAALGNQVNVQQTSPSSLEIFSPQASKGQAVQALIEQRQFDPKQVYVAGDAENDTTMFGLTPNSFAVGKLADAPTIAAASAHVDSIAELIERMA